MNTRNQKDNRARKVLALVSMVLMISAAMAAPVLGQGQIDDPEGTATGGPGGFNGTVLDIVTAQPIEGVLVQVFNTTGDAEEGNDTTLADGAYTVTEGDNGAYNISFTVDDYEPFTVNDRAVVFGDTYYLNVSLQPLVSNVSGYIYDELTMEPLANVEVHLFETTFANDIMTQTDEDGSYSFDTYTRQYYLTGFKIDYLFYEEGSDLDPMDLPINTTQSKDMVLTRDPVTLEGTVTGSGALVGAEVELVGLVDYGTTTNETGVFGFLAYWGLYELSVSYEGYYHHTEMVDLVTGGPMTNDVSMERTPEQNADVFGYVKANDTKMPIEEAMVCFIDEENGGELCMKTGVDGYFFFNIYPAYFKLQVTADDHIGHTDHVSIGKDESVGLGDLMLVTTPPMDKKVSGHVMAGGDPVPDASVVLEDAAGIVATATTNATGHYELMTYDGTFTAKIEATGHFPLTVDGIVVTAATTKDFTLVLIPAMDLKVYGYIKDGDDKPIEGASVMFVDQAADHGGHTLAALTSSGGYYSIDIYAGDFMWLVDADGFNAELQDVDITKDINLDLDLEDSVQEPVTTRITFENWNNITMTKEGELLNDIQMTRYGLDTIYGNRDGEVSAAELAALVAVEKDKGPESKDTEDLLDVDGVIYTMVEGTYDVIFEGATGDIFNDSAISFTYTVKFVAASTIEATENHFITLNVSFDDEDTDEDMVIMVPEGWEARNTTSEYVAVSGTFEVLLNPPMAEEGLDHEIVVFNVTGNSAPEADAGLNRTIKMDVNETFDAIGSEDDFGIVNYTWDFGDGETGYGVEVVHKYALPSGEDWHNYTVTLTIIDTADVANATSIWVIVDGEPPNAKFTTNKTTTEEDGDDIEFNATGQATDNVGIVNYTWDFDDGKFGYGEAVTHNWTQPGEYVVALNVTDEAGWWSTTNVTITVKDVSDPVAKFRYNGPDPYYIEEKPVAEFNASQSTDNVDVVMFKWDLGEDTIIEGADKEEVNHTYTTAGTYNITLTVLDTAGNTNTSEPYELVVKEKPKIPDLTIESIKMDPEKPRDGDEVTIRIKIVNNGDGNITADSPNTDFAVQFSYGKHKIDVKRHLEINAHASKIVKVTWKAKEGNHKICAEADWENKIGEIDENNNQKCTKKIEIGMGWRNIGIIVAVVVVLVVLVGVAAWQSKVSKEKRKEKLRKRKKR